jgi:hypothetical protein
MTTPASAPNSSMPAPEPAYRLRLDREEANTAAGALRLLISDEAHEPSIRRIAREVLSELEREPVAGQPLEVPLSPPGMKITHTAVKLLLDDLRRDQADEQRLLRQILDKLPDEHAIRAITLD